MFPKPYPRDVLKDWTIVAVDDDPGSLGIVSIVLQHYSATLFTATNGQQGLDLTLKHRPDVVITDLSMPGMDGWTMMDAIHAAPEIARTPVVALTAQAMPQHKEQAIARGFTRYITKPLMPSTFIHDLVSLLADVPELAQKLRL
ncbi:MAG: response regulator [bacterium]|nr:response regulator [bacterium]